MSSSGDSGSSDSSGSSGSASAAAMSSLSAEQHAMVAQLIDVIPHLRREEAVAWLHDHAWKLEEAISTMLLVTQQETTLMADVRAAAAAEASGATSQPRRRTISSSSSNAGVDANTTSSSAADQHDSGDGSDSESTARLLSSRSSSSSSSLSSSDGSTTPHGTAAGTGTAAGRRPAPPLTWTSWIESFPGGFIVTAVLHFFRHLLNAIVPFNQYGQPQDHYFAFTQAFPHAVAFMHGNYVQAFTEAKRRRRPMFIYLHHTGDAQAEAFCHDVLEHDSIKSILTQLTVPWIGFNNTLDGARLGSRLQAGRFPFVAMLLPAGGQAVLAFRQSGPLAVDTLRALIANTCDHYSMQVAAEMQEEEARTLDRSLRAQQDREYQEALIIDQQRRELQMQRDRERQERQERERKEQEHCERVRAARRRIRRRALLRKAKLREALGPEPVAGAAQAVGTSAAATATATLAVSLRFPMGQKMMRRFAASDTLGRVFDFIDSHVDDHFVSVSPRQAAEDADIMAEQQVEGGAEDDTSDEQEDERLVAEDEEAKRRASTTTTTMTTGEGEQPMTTGEEGEQTMTTDDGDAATVVSPTPRLVNPWVRRDGQANVRQRGTFRVVSSYPRRVYADADATLESLKLGRQVLLIVEQIHEEEEDEDGVAV